MDDDIKLLEVLKKVLSTKGNRIITTKPINQIINLVKVEKPHLIVLDYLMGEVNGGELCGILKGDLDTKDIPIIVYSIHDRVFNAFGNYGCDLFLPKTADIYSLNSEIDNLLHTRYERPN